MIFNFLKFTNLRNSEFVQFFQDLLKIALKYKPAELQIEGPYDHLIQQNSTLTTAFKQKQGSDITEELVEMDAYRDDILVGIRTLINGYTYSFVEEEKQAATKLKDSLETYGSSIKKLNYSAETSIITDIVSKWKSETELAEAIETIDKKAWIDKLDEANKSFNDTYLSRVEEAAGSSNVKLKDLRVEMAESYNTLLDHVKAFSIVNGAEAYTHLANEINKLVEEYNKMLSLREAKSNGNSSVTPLDESTD